MSTEKKSMNISRNQVFDIAIIVISLTVILFASVSIGKAISRYKGVEAELGVQVNEFLTNTDYLEILKNLEAEKSHLNYAYTVSEQYIADESDETGIVNIITDAVAGQGGKLSQIRFDNYEKLSGFQKETYHMPFSVSLTCDYAGLMNILDDL